MQFDYIIIGAGSAGNVLATRLTEDPNTSVLAVYNVSCHSLLLWPNSSPEFPVQWSL